MQDGSEPVPQNAFPVIEVIVAAIGGGGIKTVADALFFRESRQVKTLNEAMEGLGKQLERTDARLKDFEKRLHEAEAAVAACEGKHHDCENNLDELRREVERLRRVGR